MAGPADAAGAPPAWVPRLVLTEDEALELLAFLVTAARTQVEESPEYGPLRLLTAASRLADFMAERASPETRALLAGVRDVPAAALRAGDPAAYAARLDEVCAAVARHLVAHFRHAGGGGGTKAGGA